MKEFLLNPGLVMVVGMILCAAILTLVVVVNFGDESKRKGKE